MVLADNGDLVDATTYQPYGKMVPVITGTESVRERFTGKELDKDGAVYDGSGVQIAAGMELQYFGARYYDAENGTWTSGDPKDQLFNSYGYASNPISYVDPNGEYILGAIIGGLAMGYAQGVMSSGSFNPGDWEANDWMSAGMGAVSGAFMGSAIEDKIIMNRAWNGKSSWYEHKAYRSYLKSGAWDNFVASKTTGSDYVLAQRGGGRGGRTTEEEFFETRDAQTLRERNGELFYERYPCQWEDMQAQNPSNALYRRGNFSTEAREGTWIKGRNWSDQNPLRNSKAYVNGSGLPVGNRSAVPDWVAGGTMVPDATFTVEPAPGIGVMRGGWPQISPANASNVRLDFFYMP